MDLANKILKRKARVAIIGIGYVGLPLCVEIARAGYRTTGIDINSKKVNAVRRGRSFIDDVPTRDVAAVVDDSMLEATTDYRVCRNCDIIIICVPTPFTPTKDPDISYIKESGRSVARYLKPGQLIILRSTTYPETTEKILQPILEQNKLKAGKDFCLSFVPERIDPGNKKFTTRTTPIVVGGVTKSCTRLTELFFSQFVDKVFPVSSPRVAEMSKLLENIFRSVNIALVNELAKMCERMGNIDIWEVIEAASTKPFGFMPFYPGPGIGGHCILVDPYYLSWKAREYDFHSNFIELAAETNESMPYLVTDRLLEVLGTNGIPCSRARLLVLGAAFKKDVGDIRNSPAIKVMKIFMNKVRRIDYHDPYVAELEIGNKKLKSVPLTRAALRRADCVLILTDHTCFDYRMIFKESTLILDARHAIRRRGASKLYTLGYQRVKRLPTAG
ncbi:UDP-N-acetyl-D-glucosamine dehydrogenase [candidate division WOR-3 bacterium JGI_Cruoil_03_51_56]|uniref:UDP-N-acetyl-D-glucosamine dehydrogenase n=1 Tax=candidate division WOR-3 bacterium JGI_Cruoil_03_51_56 TaxID=1973747 RepID=A0A235BVG4_UNCW3|nr:MAG: UDP-N-acetyl-D-glucosamine dehydrogenase [candidate division WOR-3 bacterium JGI_Cruoil_03_51_56]